MHPFRLIVIGGTGFGVLAMLLPFASFPVVGAVDGISADAWPTLLPLMVVLIISLTGRWNEGLGAVAGVAAVLAAGSSLLFSVVKVTDAVTAVRDTAGASLGPGPLVLLAAVVVVLGGAAAGALSRS
jgi:hypothetical protein